MTVRTDSGWRATLVESYPDLFYPAGDALAAEGWRGSPDVVFALAIEMVPEELLAALGALGSDGEERDGD